MKAMMAVIILGLLKVSAAFVLALIVAYHVHEKQYSHAAFCFCLFLFVLVTF